MFPFLSFLSFINSSPFFLSFLLFFLFSFPLHFSPAPFFLPSSLLSLQQVTATEIPFPMEPPYTPPPPFSSLPSRMQMMSPPGPPPSYDECNNLSSNVSFHQLTPVAVPLSDARNHQYLHSFMLSALLNLVTACLLLFTRFLL